MDMLFTIYPHPHPSTYANTNVGSFSSFPIPIQESNSHQEEINVVAITNDVLPPSVVNDDSDKEVDDVDVVRVDNFIQNSEHDYSESEDSDFDNPPIPLPPPEPPDEEFDFEINLGNGISVVRNMIVKFESNDARVKFDIFNDENNVLSYFMFKELPLLFAKSEDTIFDPGERKTRKGQNWIKTGQKREACRSREKFKAVTVGRGRKSQKEWPKTQALSKAIQVFKEKRKEKGQKYKF
nr:hypothetical protein [Tanacetum cinerariifolium]